MRPLVIYHGPSCPDGWCSCWIAHRIFGNDADYVPAQYGQEPSEAAFDKDRKLYILDFSYPRDVLFRIAALRHEEVIVLDHHKTAAQALNGLEIELAANNCGDALTVRFDMNKSGARLTWEHFFPNTPASWLVDYVEDRDLWRWQLPDSKEISASLASRPRTFEEWNYLHEHGQRPVGFRELVTEGAAILRYQNQQIDTLCAHAHEIELDGHRILTVNTSVLFSEVAGKLAEGRPFGAVWFQRADGKRQFSLRSTPSGLDVGEIARRHGGGGHPHAAGYTE